jgi:peptidoglycan L-alanyl-D-glutamate endopeptidase CwlK
MSRKIEDLKPEAQLLARAFAKKMVLAGIPFMWTCTFRSQAEQEALYAQGRTKPGKVVTWTKHSEHTKRTAFDIAILKSGQPVWDIKVDVNEDDIPDYKQAGEIGEACGLIWGGRWKPSDPCHFQMPEG